MAALEEDGEGLALHAHYAAVSVFGGDGEVQLARCICGRKSAAAVFPTVAGESEGRINVIRLRGE